MAICWPEPPGRWLRIEPASLSAGFAFCTCAGEGKPYGVAQSAPLEAENPWSGHRSARPRRETMPLVPEDGITLHRQPISYTFIVSFRTGHRRQMTPFVR